MSLLRDADRDAADRDTAPDAAAPPAAPDDTRVCGSTGFSFKHPDDPNLSPPGTHAAHPRIPAQDLAA